MEKLLESKLKPEILRGNFKEAGGITILLNGKYLNTSRDV